MGKLIRGQVLVMVLRTSVYFGWKPSNRYHKIFVPILGSLFAKGLVRTIVPSIVLLPDRWIPVPNASETMKFLVITSENLMAHPTPQAWSKDTPHTDNPRESSPSNPLVGPELTPRHLREPLHEQVLLELLEESPVGCTPPHSPEHDHENPH